MAREVPYLLGSGSLKASGVKPSIQDGSPHFTMVVGWNVVAGNVEEVADRAVVGNQPLLGQQRAAR